MMNPDEKAEWVAALRSDKYIQGSGGLRDAFNGFCCLGVLADILVKKGKGQWAGASYLVDGVYFNAFLDIDYLKQRIQIELAEMNDSGSFDFNDIAQFIEDSDEI